MGSAVVAISPGKNYRGLMVSGDKIIIVGESDFTSDKFMKPFILSVLKDQFTNMRFCTAKKNGSFPGFVCGTLAELVDCLIYI